ncbi:MAG: prephenate/arogenate dehydrogenase [Cyanobacteria bacterium J06621_8]
MRIGIIGLGLIGGSLARDWRSQGHHISGISRNKDTCQTALEKGIVDQAGVEFELLKDTEVVVICTPLGAIATTVKQASPYLNPDTIITDVGSVKYPIVKSCVPLWQNFIGGHPMAGTTASGINAALSNLFVGAAYVLTPIEENKPEHIDKLKGLILELKAIPYICDPQVHDRAVSLISHLPVMVSASLLQACLKAEPNTLELAQTLASSGFKDTSRVGGGNPELGMMMAKYNRKELLRSLNSYRTNLDRIIELIEAEKWQDLSQVLQENQEARGNFLNDN